jgi:hypothetical protein
MMIMLPLRLTERAAAACWVLTAPRLGEGDVLVLDLACQCDRVEPWHVECVAKGQRASRR